MGIKARWICSILLLLTIVGLITFWEEIKPEKPTFYSVFGNTPEQVKGKRYASIDEAIRNFEASYFDTTFLTRSPKVYYEANDKFINEGRIPALLTYYQKNSEKKKDEFQLAPFYINVKDNQYSLSSYAHVGSSDKLKDSPKYEVFTQFPKGYDYEFIISYDKKNLPKSDAILRIKKENFYIGIRSFADDKIKK